MMKLIIEPQKIEWWFWTVTLACMIAALVGWTQGYYLVMLISAVQVVYFWVQTNNLWAFDSQVRIVYLAFTLLGLIEPIRFVLYLLLALGTLMVVLFNRCGIALALKKMPWNKQPLDGIQMNI